MIVFVRTGAIAPGKGVEAWAFAHKAAAYWKKNFKQELQLLRPIGGNPNRIAWSTRYSNLAAFEATTGKAMQDKKYLELLVTAGPLFIPGGIHDALWATA